MTLTALQNQTMHKGLLNQLERAKQDEPSLGLLAQFIMADINRQQSQRGGVVQGRATLSINNIEQFIKKAHQTITDLQAQLASQPIAPPPPPPTEEWITVRRYHQIYGTPISTIYDLKRTGRLPWMPNPQRLSGVLVRNTPPSPARNRKP